MQVVLIIIGLLILVKIFYWLDQKFILSQSQKYRLSFADKIGRAIITPQILIFFISIFFGVYVIAAYSAIGIIGTAIFAGFYKFFFK